MNDSNIIHSLYKKMKNGYTSITLYFARILILYALWIPFRLEKYGSYTGKIERLYKDDLGISEDTIKPQIWQRGCRNPHFFAPPNFHLSPTLSSCLLCFRNLPYITFTYHFPDQELQESLYFQ